jgi:hypothetical protein
MMRRQGFGCDEKGALHATVVRIHGLVCGRMPTSKLYAQSREPGDGRILGKLGVAPLSDLIFGGVFRVSVFRTKILDLTFISCAWQARLLIVVYRRHCAESSDFLFLMRKNP